MWVSLLYIFVKLNIKAKKNLVLGAKKKQRHQKKIPVNLK